MAAICLRRLQGLLPDVVESIDLQAERVMFQLHHEADTGLQARSLQSDSPQLSMLSMLSGCLSNHLRLFSQKACVPHCFQFFPQFSCLAMIFSSAGSPCFPPLCDEGCDAALMLSSPYDPRRSTCSWRSWRRATRRYFSLSSCTTWRSWRPSSTPPSSARRAPTTTASTGVLAPSVSVPEVQTPPSGSMPWCCLRHASPATVLEAALVASTCGRLYSMAT